MDKPRQLEILQEIIHNITNDLKHAVKAMPEEFDGFEIRQAALDYVKSEIAFHGKDYLRSSTWNRRKRKYAEWKRKHNDRQMQATTNRYYL